VATGARPTTRVYKPAQLFATVMHYLFNALRFRLRTDINRNIKTVIKNSGLIEEVF
jgi:hypothetical protein